MIAKVAKLVRIDADDEADIEKAKELGLVAREVSRGTDWYAYLRDYQGNLKGYLELGLFPNNPEFLEDSLFCEYAYLVNLDTSRVEYYKGFQKTENGYGPVAKVGEITFAEFQQLDNSALYKRMAAFYDEDENDEDEDS